MKEIIQWDNKTKCDYCNKESNYNCHFLRNKELKLVLCRECLNFIKVITKGEED